MATLLSDLLTVLGVHHTELYSDKRFSQMPFRSMFGLSKLLREYGVATAGISVASEERRNALAVMPVPFLADMPDGFIIVEKIGGGQVTYLSQHKEFEASIDAVLDAWNGVALLVSDSSESIEPGYTRHHVAEIASGVKRWTLLILLPVLLVVGMWADGLYCHVAAWVVMIFDIAGLWFSWSLVQKSLGIHTAAANAVCSAIEEGGCDEIAQSEASSFMGIVKWSEVGLAYFSVSLMAMLLFPQTLPALAAINILCLPYTVWSISYQKFVAKTWCTLCVCVQCTLWLLFVAYLIGGWTKQVFPLGWDFVILGCVYGVVLLAINRFDDFLIKRFAASSSASEVKTS